MTAYSSVDMHQRFEGTCCSRFKTHPTFMPLPTFLRWRRMKFLRNVSTWHYTASYQKTVQAQRPTRLDGAREDKTCKVTYKGNVGARSRHHCWRGRARSIAYSECEFVALVIQQPMRMRRIILSPVACPAVQYFSTVSHKRQNFRGGNEHKMSVFIFSTVSVPKIYHSEKNSASYKCTYVSVMFVRF